MEKWIGFPGWEDRYDISSYGRLRGYVWGRKSLSVPRLVKTTKDKRTGYHKIMLHRGKEMKSSVIHRWVLLAFKGLPPDSKMEACHNDGNKDNNRLSNLRWDTKKNNKADMHKHGTALVGQKGGNSKLTEKQVIMMRKKHQKGAKLKHLSTLFSCSISTVWLIVNRKTWSNI